MATSRRHHPLADREHKKERIELRVTPSAKLLIQRAMAVSGLTVGDLACEGARRVLDEHERMVLIGADRDAFLAAAMEPPEPTEKLVAALRRHRGTTRAKALVRSYIPEGRRLSDELVEERRKEPPIE